MKIFNVVKNFLQGRKQRKAQATVGRIAKEIEARRTLREKELHWSDNFNRRR